jgi:UDP-N-acetylglucosamine diphosphorylase/glucosamine-1-phosphate N-acetyltransferase
MKLYVFDDRIADAWLPFSLTRPCSELLFGTLLLRERLERFAGRPASALLSRDWLSSFQEAGAPPVVSADSLSADEERLILLARFVPSAEARFEGRGERALLLQTDDQIVGCYLPAGVPGPGPEWLETPSASTDATWEPHSVEGGHVDAAWRLIAENPGRLGADLAADGARRGGVERLPEGTWSLGEHPILLGAGTVLEPGVVLDTTGGPIRLDDEVHVRAGCRLEGPLYAGRSSILLGGAIGTSSIGPVSRVRGEIEESVILGHVNKAHDGFLGHSYLGRWVNLGALTTNSDLKNNYGPVRLGSPHGPVETGLTKLGCLLGDHVKTAIGTRINTGTVVGAGANLFGDGLSPSWIPAFAWGSDADAVTYQLDRFLAVARRVFERRGVEYDDGTTAWLSACWRAASESSAR